MKRYIKGATDTGLILEDLDTAYQQFFDRIESLRDNLEESRASDLALDLLEHIQDLLQR